MGGIFDMLCGHLRRTGNAAEEAMDARGVDLGIRVDGRLAGMTPASNRGMADRMGENSFVRRFGQSVFDDDYDGKV